MNYLKNYTFANIIMLEVTNLIKRYRNQLAVNRVSFTVHPERIFGLLGPNGAGKSSLLRMITGITLPDEGEVHLNGNLFDIKKHLGLIGYMPEERGLYKKMKVKDHMIYLGKLKGLSNQEVSKQIGYWFDKLDMNSWTDKKVEDLSKGMSQKLQFVGTVLHDPMLLILDEPFSGLDPVNSGIIKNEIFELSKKGKTIIFSTHRMEQVEEVCEDIVLMNEGEIILGGSVRDIKQHNKENRFLIKTNSEIDNSFYKILSKSINEYGQNEYILEITEQQTSEYILSSLLKENIKITHFEEILPSLNEIFIKQVQNSAIRQFK